MIPPARAGRGQREPGETCAEGTLRRLLDRHGEAHLHDVLTIIMETKNNRRALVAPVITAVSATLLAHQGWYARNAGLFLEVVDRVRLQDLHARAKRHRRSGVEPWKGIATMLAEELASVFEPREPDLVDKAEAP